MRFEIRPKNQSSLRPLVDAAIGSWAGWNSPIHCLRIPRGKNVTLLWLPLNQPSKQSSQSWRISIRGDSRVFLFAVGFVILLATTEQKSLLQQLGLELPERFQLNRKCS